MRLTLLLRYTSDPKLNINSMLLSLLIYADNLIVYKERPNKTPISTTKHGLRGII